MERELLALLIEVTSVSAAGKQLRKPIEVPRPGKGKRAPAASSDAAYAHGVSVLRSTARPKAVSAG